MPNARSLLPEVLAALLDAGNTHLRARAFDEARNNFYLATEIHSGIAAAWLGLARIAELEGRRTAYLDTARKATACDPNDETCQLAYASALHLNGDLGEAWNIWRGCTNRFPLGFEAHDRLAYVNFFYGDLRACLDHTEQAVALGMPQRDHTVNYGVHAAIMLGETERAVALSGASANNIARQDFQSRAAERRAFLAKHLPESGPTTDPKAAFEAILDRLKHGELESAEALLAVHHDVDFEPENISLLHAYSMQFLQKLMHSGANLIASMTHRIVRSQPIGERNVDIQLRYATQLAEHGFFVDNCRTLNAVVWNNVYHPHADFVLRALTMNTARGYVSADHLRTMLEILRPHVQNAGVITFCETFLQNSTLGPRDIAAGNTLTGDTSMDPRQRAASLTRRFSIQPGRIRPRLALCLSGQLRSFRETWAGTREALSGFDVEIFVSTWERTGVGIGTGGWLFGDQRALTRLLPQDLANRLPGHMNAMGFVRNRYKHLTALLLTDGRVTRDEMINFFGTPHVEVLNEAEFEADLSDAPGLVHQGSLNQAKMFYGISRVLQMRRQFEIDHNMTFDCVMRLRPDRRVWSVAHTDIERVRSGHRYLVDEMKQLAVGDQVALMRSCVADEVEQIWHAIRAAGTPRCHPGFTGDFNELLLGQYLVYSGIRPEYFDGTSVSPIIPVSHSAIDIWQNLVRDLEEKSDLDAEDTIFAKLCLDSARARDASLSWPATLARMAR